MKASGPGRTNSMRTGLGRSRDWNHHATERVYADRKNTHRLNVWAVVTGELRTRRRGAEARSVECGVGAPNKKKKTRGVP